jgi:hypothetical protein
MDDQFGHRRRSYRPSSSSGCSVSLNPLYKSRRVRRPHPLRDLPALLPLDQRNVVLALQIEPELRAVTEIAAEPHRGVGGDRAPGVENVGDAAGRHADVERQPVGGELARRQFALEQAAGM